MKTLKSRQKKSLKASLLITDISSQAKNPLRENVYLDGQFAFGISAEKRFEHRLKIGKTLSTSDVNKLVLEDQVGKLLDAALNFLSVRPRSVKETRNRLRMKLDRWDYVDSDLTLDKVILKLTKMSLLNDLEFAKWWVEQRKRFKPRGERVLRSELHGKGVPREIIDDLFFAYEPDQSEIETLALKKYSAYSKLPKLEFQTKLSNFLARKGYGWDEIKTVVDRLSQSR